MPARDRERISLCILSTAAGGHYEDADCFKQQCPLGLSKAEAERCPCKTRAAVGRVGGLGYKTAYGRSSPTSEQVVRVLRCLFPETWNGDTIRNVAAFARAIKRRQ